MAMILERNPRSDGGFMQFIPASPMSSTGTLTPNIVSFGEDAPRPEVVVPDMALPWKTMAKMAAFWLGVTAVGAFVVTKVVQKSWTRA